MIDEQLDNIPLLDELIEKGSPLKPMPNSDLEEKIKHILQRHSAEAIAEITAIIEADKNNNA